jgi:hypothetical protein
MAPEINKLLTTKEAAERLNITPHALSVWRCTKRYPLKYVKVGGAVRYRLQDIEQFVNSRVRGDDAVCA